jgi:antitoxin (DNA-binding transcriptional repressor) of toxin-antitoxin stability system
MKIYALDREPPPLSALVEEVKHGEEIVLTDHDRPVARLLPAEESKSKIAPVAGSLKGFWMAPDFDEPLEDFREYME